MTRLTRMTEAEYQDYLEASIPAYAQDKILSGQWAPSEALALARQSMQDSLPQGLDTVDNYLYTLRHGATEEVVGMLWIAAQQRGVRKVAYVYDVIVHEAYRRQGHATRAFAALEKEVLALGLSGIGLHVFAHNHSAHALYVKLGYVATNINMFKVLGDA
ncbi:MAG: GNAT family N-acetyltransferase [Burkholderiales bacterium PBB4]|nr:MAG: GNAT family N-acetyltransferase [Burkholderiales bacterium PBB4]